MSEPGAVFEADFEGHAIGKEAGDEGGTGNEGSRVGGSIVPTAPAIEHALTVLASCKTRQMSVVDWWWGREAHVLCSISTDCAA